MLTFVLRHLRTFPYSPYLYPYLPHEDSSSSSNVFVSTTHSYVYVAFSITTSFSALYPGSCLLRDSRALYRASVYRALYRASAELYAEPPQSFMQSLHRASCRASTELYVEPPQSFMWSLRRALCGASAELRVEPPQSFMQSLRRALCRASTELRVEPPQSFVQSLRRASCRASYRASCRAFAKL